MFYFGDTGADPANLFQIRWKLFDLIIILKLPFFNGYFVFLLQ